MNMFGRFNLKYLRGFSVVVVEHSVFYCPQLTDQNAVAGSDRGVLDFHERLDQFFCQKISSQA